MKVNALRDVHPSAISLVSKGANRKRFFLKKTGEVEEGDGGPADAMTLPGSHRLVKSDDWRAVYCVVAEPGWQEDPGMGAPEPDVPDVWADEEEIRKAAHRFMQNGGLVNAMHASLDPYGQVVENYIAPGDFTINGETIRKGSWVIAIAPNPTGRAAIEAGEFAGVSLEGTGLRVAVEKGTFDESVHPRGPDGKWIDNVGDLAKAIEQSTGATVEVSERTDGIVLSSIKTGEGTRGAGAATAALQQIIAYADHKGKPIALTPDPIGSGGLSATKLKAWYTRHGFVPNKGRNKDYAFTESMIRPHGTVTKGAFDEAKHARDPHSGMWIKMKLGLDSTTTLLSALHDVRDPYGTDVTPGSLEERLTTHRFSGAKKAEHFPMSHGDLGEAQTALFEQVDRYGGHPGPLYDRLTNAQRKLEHRIRKADEDDQGDDELVEQAAALLGPDVDQVELTKLVEIAKTAETATASTVPEPVGPGLLWNTPGIHLPPYVQHLANDLKGTESHRIRLAIGIVRNWSQGHDGQGHKVSAEVQAAAVKAMAQLKVAEAKAHAYRAQHAAAMGDLHKAAVFDEAKHPRGPHTGQWIKVAEKLWADNHRVEVTDGPLKGVVGTVTQVESDPSLPGWVHVNAPTPDGHWPLSHPVNQLRDLGPTRGIEKPHAITDATRRRNRDIVEGPRKVAKQESAPLRGTLGEMSGRLARRIAKAVGIGDDEFDELVREDEIAKAPVTFAEAMAARDLEDELPDAFNVLRETVWKAFYPPPGEDYDPKALIGQSLDEFKTWALGLIDKVGIAKLGDQVGQDLAEEALLESISKAASAVAAQRKAVQDAMTVAHEKYPDGIPKSVTTAIFKDPAAWLKANGGGDKVAKAASTDAAWDGSASRFTDEQYRASCVLDRGADAGSAKERYGLPIREPDGTIIVKALSSAASALSGGGSEVEGASPEQVAVAKAKLASAYNVADLEVPASLAKFAAVGSAPEFANVDSEMGFSTEERQEFDALAKRVDELPELIQGKVAETVTEAITKAKAEGTGSGDAADAPKLEDVTKAVDDLKTEVEGKLDKVTGDIRKLADGDTSQPAGDPPPDEEHAEKLLKAYEELDLSPDLAGIF